MTDTRTAEDAPVLVVDDDPVVRAFVRGTLKGLGLEVVLAEDGEEALEEVARQKPQLVLLDVEMPRLDGHQTCARLRETPGFEMIPVMIMTGNSDSESIQKAFDAGASDFIPKPLNPAILRHRVRFLLRAAEASEELRETLANLKMSQLHLKRAQSLARIGSWEWAPSEGGFLCSDQAQAIFGVEEPWPDPHAMLKYVLDEDRGTLEEALSTAERDGRDSNLDFTIRTSKGEELVLNQGIEVISDSEGKPAVVTGTLQDITDRKKAEESIRQLAFFDPLTSLPNRRMVREHLDRVIEASRARGKKSALLFVDIDRFKRINDTLGHSAGDDLLREVAIRLVNAVRTSDLVGRTGASVARLGGDEFTVVLPELNGAENASLVARRILTALEHPVTIGGHEVVVTASVGIAIFPEDGDTSDILLERADLAMYEAKRTEAGGYQFFDEKMNASAMLKLNVENGLRQALETGVLEVFYQPKMRASTGAISGAEGLCRWMSDGKPVRTPDEFIPVAEETGLIVPMGEYVLEQACRDFVVLPGSPGFRVAINVSTRQIHASGFVEMVADILERTGLDGERLELELTESIFLNDTSAAKETLWRVKDLGVTLALDDFGTGYSAMRYLKSFPIDRIKIDREFVQEIHLNEENQAIVAAIIAMSRRLGIEVTAEGVETTEEEAVLKGDGCDELQGFLYSKPLPRSEFEVLLKRSDVE